MFEPVIGGVPAYVLDLTASLRDRGWEAEVASPESPSLTSKMEERGIPHWPVRLPHSLGPADARAAWQLLGIARARRPALIHAHSSKAGPIAALVGRAIDVPVVYTPHTWSFQRADIGRVSARLFTGIERVVARLHETLVFVSAAERDAAMAARIAPRDASHVVHTGMSLRRCPRARSHDSVSAWSATPSSPFG